MIIELTGCDEQRIYTDRKSGVRIYSNRERGLSWETRE
jgi:hypothetical protein